MKTTRITTASAIIRFLKAQYIKRDGVEHRLINGIAGIFGHGVVAGLGQALEESGGSDLPYIQTKNEQAAVHIATAYAKTRRGLGTMACTSSVGPGATNMVTGAATATVDHIPVLLFPGDIFSGRRVMPVLQQLENPTSQDISANDCFRPVSRYWDRINRPEQILTALPEAMRVLASPADAGAVTIALPEDVQAEAFDCPVSFFEKRVYDVDRQVPAQAALARAVEAIRSSRRPMIVAGGGVYYSHAGDALAEFAEETGIPVGCTQAGMGSLHGMHEMSLGGVGHTGTEAATKVAEQADLVIVVGTRLTDFTTASKSLWQNPKVRFVSINTNAMDAAKHGALPLVGDARATLSALQRMLRGWQTPKAYRTFVTSAKRAWAKTWDKLTNPQTPADGRLYQSQTIRVVNDFIGKDATVVHASGGIPGDIHKLWRSKSSTDYHSEYGYSCMGYEIAGALGVKIAAPEREVYAFLGDGSYLMLNHELLTSIQEGYKITIVLNDNHGFGCIHSLQRACGGRSFGNEFRMRDRKTGRLVGIDVPVDYMMNARSLGAKVFSATDEDSLRAALKAARAEKTSCLIYVPISKESNLSSYAWWCVPPAELSTVPGVRKARKAYEAALKKQRFYY